MSAPLAESSFTIAICKGSGLLSETRTLLDTWRPGESPTELAERVLAEGQLGRSTAYRTRDVVKRMFGARFLRGTDAPARHLKCLLAEKETGPWFRDLCLLFACRADFTLRAAISEFLADTEQQGALVISTEAVQEWLLEQQGMGRMAKPWSTEVIKKVSRGLVRAMVDFRLLDEETGRLKRIRTYRPSVLAAAYLAHDLHGAGVSDQALFEHRDWACWLQGRDQVRELLEDVAEQGHFILQVGGGVVRITWRYANAEEALDALAR